MRNRLRKRWIVLFVEVAWVVLFGLYVGREYLNFDPGYRVHGREIEWVASSAAYVSQVWQQDGYIPRWMPYINRGQPSVDQGVSMIFNPIASIPSLIWGVTNGLKVSIVLFFILGGAGGLALGHVLGWAWPARILLAGLLIARGTTHAQFGHGYMLLAAQQMYFPWVMAGVMGMVSGQRPRLFVALTAIALSQTYLTGNVYYILPAAVIAGVLVLMFAVRLQPRPRVDWALIRRSLLAALFAAGLMAAAAFSTLVLYGYLGNHTDYTPVQTQNLATMLLQYVVPNELTRFDILPDNRYSFVTPFWLLVLVFLLLPPIPRLLYRSKDRGTDTRLWLFLIIGFVFFATMGAGVNPVASWLWENVSVLRQWRFHERMLGVAGFMLAVLIALRVAGLWRAAMVHRQRVPVNRPGRLNKAFMDVVLVITAVCAFAAPLWVEDQRTFRFGLEKPDSNLNNCLAELRAQYPNPNDILLVDSGLYVSIWAYHRHGVRLASMQADYDQLGRAPTLFMNDLTNLPGAFYIPYGENMTGRIDQGYALYDGVRECVGQPWFYFNPNAVSYAFSAPVRVFETNDIEQVKQNWSPVEVMRFEPERNVLRAENPTEEPIAVVAQTIVYPGWEARIDGQPAQLESVGQLLGVILPPNTPPVEIEFIYYPTVFEIGGLITIATSIVLIGYLLRVDEHVRHWRKRRTQPEPVQVPVAMLTDASPVAQAAPAPVQEVPAMTRRPGLRLIVAALLTAGAIAGAAGAFVVGWVLGRNRGRP
jgi:hypothetical protein